MQEHLAGDTLRALKARLEADGVPYITGEPSWNISGLQSILQNEKYCGDVLLPSRTAISKKVVKNLMHQLLEEVEVLSADRLLVRFRNGMEVEQELGGLEEAA